MGMSLLMDKLSVFLFFALMSRCSTVELEYFNQSSILSWDEARHHCQSCFKDLVTLTPQNIGNVSQGLDSEHWIGLRRNFSSGNQTLVWSHWANGDPLVFQNWYLRWPLSKPLAPKAVCCSCSCTCPKMRSATVTSTAGMTTEETATTGMTTAEMATAGVREEASTCVRSLMPQPEDPEEEEETFIDDSCVAMLSFGAWVEKNCSEHLPFICYDEKFSGHVNVTKRTTNSAVITWEEAHGTNHYRLEVNNYTVSNTSFSELTYELRNLTAGTHYSVKVFPVKCGRELNPQEVDFYTKPHKIENLTVTNWTERSISLRWDSPNEGLEYVIEVEDREIHSDTESAEVKELIPGTPYTFNVLAKVKDNSTQSAGVNTTAYTKPGKVSNMTASNNTQSSLWLTWSPPEGNKTEYNVTAFNDTNHLLFHTNVSEEKVNVTGLPMTSRITLSVRAVANETLGDVVTIISYTYPGPISNLSLDTTHDSLTATWRPGRNLMPSNYSYFTIELQLDGETVNTTQNLTEQEIHFDKLKTAANYTVIVYVTSGNLQGPVEEGSKFTLPMKPTNISFVNVNESQIDLQWEPPSDAAPSIKYRVNIYSSFWGLNQTKDADQNNTTFSDLMSGTNYSFEVRTVADNLLSEPTKSSHLTVPVKYELSLSMLCSSAEVLQCDKNTTREIVFQQMSAYFSHHFGERIFWKLENQTTGR